MSSTEYEGRVRIKYHENDTLEVQVVDPDVEIREINNGDTPYSRTYFTPRRIFGIIAILFMSIILVFVPGIPEQIDMLISALWGGFLGSLLSGL